MAHEPVVDKMRLSRLGHISLHRDLHKKRQDAIWEEQHGDPKAAAEIASDLRAWYKGIFNDAHGAIRKARDAFIPDPTDTAPNRDTARSLRNVAVKLLIVADVVAEGRWDE